MSNSGDGTPWGGIYQQQLGAMQLAQNLAWTTTTNGSTGNTITLTVSDADQFNPPAKAKDPDEFAWLKKRVREIEWRP
jgi:hypothetical protein